MISFSFREKANGDVRSCEPQTFQNVAQNLISQNYMQTLNPAYICLKVKIQFEALQPFCEQQIFSDPAQVRTHP